MQLPTDPTWLEVFAHRIKESGECWLWTEGLKSHDGYGEVWFQQSKNATHRLSYELIHDVLLQSDEWILHTCDTPGCVRPEHLFVGSHQDNMSDMVSKGRQAYGENHGQCKLTDKQVLEIRFKSVFFTQRVLAKEYDVSLTQINHILSFKRR